MAGPNHVLPTGGTARFASPLNIDDFLKKEEQKTQEKKDYENKLKSEAEELSEEEMKVYCFGENHGLD